MEVKCGLPRAPALGPTGVAICDCSVKNIFLIFFSNRSRVFRQTPIDSTKKPILWMRFLVEVTGGFEPPEKGFANPPFRPLRHVTPEKSILNPQSTPTDGGLSNPAALSPDGLVQLGLQAHRKRICENFLRKPVRR